MKRAPHVGYVCIIFALSLAWGSAPGDRIGAEDVVLQLPGLVAETWVGVDPGFDYASCHTFPVPMDLRCGLLASSQFDAEGRQYASRYTNSGVTAVLPRTELWRTRFDGTSELVGYLEPRVGPGGTFDDGRIERIAVDSVRGEILIFLTTACSPSGAPACGYGRANAVIRVRGLKTLSDVLKGI
jgi:hypothetical protein